MLHVTYTIFTLQIELNCAGPNRAGPVIQTMPARFGPAQSGSVREVFTLSKSDQNCSNWPPITDDLALFQVLV